MWNVIIGVEDILPSNFLRNIMSTYRSVKTKFQKFSLLLCDGKIQVLLTLSTPLMHYRDCGLGLLLYWFLNWAIDCGPVVNFIHRPLYPRGEKHFTLFMGGWVGPIFGFDSLEERKPVWISPGIYPRLFATRWGNLTALLRARHVNCNGNTF
jgi:hypothetical protein